MIPSQFKYSVKNSFFAERLAPLFLINDQIPHSSTCNSKVVISFGISLMEKLSQVLDPAKKGIYQQLLLPSLNVARLLFIIIII